LAGRVGEGVLYLLVSRRLNVDDGTVEEVVSATLSLAMKKAVIK
jgi:hypothetical protein